MADTADGCGCVVPSALYRVLLLLLYEEDVADGGCNFLFTEAMARWRVGESLVVPNPSVSVLSIL